LKPLFLKIVKEIFGLKDPVILAIVSDHKDGIYTKSTLSLIQLLHSNVRELDNIRDDRVFSIASEASISEGVYGVRVEDYLVPLPVTTAEIQSVRKRVESMPPHFGSLVSKDGTAAIIVAEVIDEGQVDHSLLALAERTNAELVLNSRQIQLHVAGQGAVGGYLSRYIDEDGSKLRPLAIVIILLILLLAFRKIKSLLPPLLIIAGSTIGSLGIMGWLGVNYYAITSALPVVLIAVSVADAIHILTRYYELTGEDPEALLQHRILQSLNDMWRPITLTTFTTIAGFIGISVTSIMPPVSYFGWFAALGILIAWLFSLTVLPAAMVLLNLKASPAFGREKAGGSDIFGRALTSISLMASRSPIATLLAFVLIGIALALVATNLRIDRAQIENFQKNEPIYMADDKRLSGTAYLDVVVQADKAEGLLNARRIQKIAALQDFLVSLPHVQHSSSIADYMTLLHSALGGEGKLPTSDDAISQYLLMYEASGDPTDFEDKIDGDYQSALVRGVMNSRYTSSEVQTVEQLEAYLKSTFNEPGMAANLSGRVNIDYHWMKRLGESHFLGVVLALALVFLCSAFLFKDPLAGLLSLVPSGFAILIVYAMMAVKNIHLEVATSMFAAISVGLGVDYAIHLIERLRRGVRIDQLSVADSIGARFPGGARACFFNAAGLSLGFLALAISQLPTLQRFVALAAMSSYVAALLVIPATYALVERLKTRRNLRLRPNVSFVGSIVFVSVLALLGSDIARADSRADEIAQSVQARPDGDASQRVIEMTLIDRRGKTRQRKAEIFRTENDGLRYTLVKYTSPKRIRNTAFLSHDPLNSGADERWLYLPATKKVRRIPSSDRGDYFLGTDFTYEDMNSQLKFNKSDYQFSYVKKTSVNGRQTHIIKGVPISKKVSKELGYGGLVATIDELSWMPIEIEFVDPDRRQLKKVF